MALRRPRAPTRQSKTIELLMWQAHQREKRIVQRLDCMWLRHPLWVRRNGTNIALRRYYRLRHTPEFKIPRALRHRLWYFAKGFKSTSMRRLVGCSRAQLLEHLKRQFRRGMTIENYGKWEIDHIIPCTMYDLTNPEHQAQCFHFTNLQPMWKGDNIRKGNKLHKPAQMHLPLYHP